MKPTPAPAPQRWPITHLNTASTLFHHQCSKTNGPSPTALNPGSQHRLSTQALNTGSQPRLSTQALNPGSQPRLSTQALNPGSQPRLSTQALNPGSQPRLSTQALNPGSHSRSPASLDEAETLGVLKTRLDMVLDHI